MSSLKAAYKKKVELNIVPNVGLLPGQKYAFLYTRVSLILDKDQKKNGESNSLVQQDTQLTDYCQNNNLIILDKYSDPSIGGATIKKRPGLIKMLEELKRGIVVVVSTVSRLSRNTEDLLYINRTIMEKGAELIILDLPVPASTPMGEMMLSLLGSLVTMERKQNNIKISQTMLSMKKEGTLITRPKYGYRLVDKKYVEDEDEQKVINAVRILLDDDPDISTNAIIRALDEVGFKNKKGNKFHISTVESIIKEINNPTVKQINQLSDVVKNKKLHKLMEEKEIKNDL